MATLVTGGTGFVGANIVRDLAQNGHQVVSFDMNEPDALMLEFLGDSALHATFVQGDIVDRGSVERLANSHFIDKIIHAAVYTVNREALEIEHQSVRLIDVEAGHAGIIPALICGLNPSLAGLLASPN